MIPARAAIAVVALPLVLAPLVHVLPLALAPLAHVLAAARPAPPASAPAASPASADRRPWTRARTQPGDTVRYVVLMQGNPAGEELVWSDDGGVWHARFHYSDRGRGPELDAVVEAEEATGLPVRLEVSGVDYLKSPVGESMVITDPATGRVVSGDTAGTPRRARAAFAGARAEWLNQGEEGTRVLDGPALYVPLNGTPSLQGLLARALLADPDRCLPALPAGRACLETVGRETVRLADGRTEAATLHAVSGLGFSPRYLWTGADGSFVGQAGGWLTVLPEGWEGAGESLAEAERRAEDAWLRRLADSLPRHPDAGLAITGARLFDPATLEVREGHTVVVRDGRIAAVGPDGAMPVPDGARVVDAAGRTLLPGLFDMHVHLSPVDGVLQLAAGVTTVRDLANDVERLQEMRRAFEAGELIGPRVVMAGFLDGPGPFAGPTKALVDTPEEVREWVARYDSLGYRQIKVYSSIDTTLVPVIVEAAHGRGMRVSGHIPAWMTAEEAVRAGFDEIQHANMLVLNFLGDTLDTRTPVRFRAPAARGAELDVSSDSVRAFIRLLAENDVVVDPTLAIFEDMFLSEKGRVSPAYAVLADRLPPGPRRGLQTGGLPVPDGEDESFRLNRYRASFERMQDLVRALHESGVRLVAGTDGMAGFTLNRELELYQDAGIPAPEVLRIATLGAARVAGVADSLGTVERGKLADLVLVDGRPDEDVSALRRPALVVKGGVLYEPEALWGAVGVEPPAQPRGASSR